MNDLISIGIGIAVGSLCTILDKRMIVNLLKQALRENKPKRVYKKKTSYSSRSKTDSTKSKVN